VLAIDDRMKLDYIRGYGFTAIAVALLGCNSGVGIVAGALLSSFLDRASTGMGLSTGVPKEVTFILQDVIILTIVVAYEVVRRLAARGQLRERSTTSVPEILLQLFGFATIASAIRAFVPLYLATLGGVFNERSGVLNIGIDGMMIFGAWFGAWGGAALGAGRRAAGSGGRRHPGGPHPRRGHHHLPGRPHRLRCRHQHPGDRPAAVPDDRHLRPGNPVAQVDQLPKFSLPRLGAISLVVPLTLLLGVAAWYVLSRTVFGLRLRSAGENPRAAETLGVRVVVMRYAGVLISGAFAGLAGGYLSIELAGLYREVCSCLRGYQQASSNVHASLDQ
jgi:general nucleoside transport system permease protein